MAYLDFRAKLKSNGDKASPYFSPLWNGNTANKYFLYNSIGHLMHTHFIYPDKVLQYFDSNWNVGQYFPPKWIMGILKHINNWCSYYIIFPFSPVLNTPHQRRDKQSAIMSESSIMTKISLTSFTNSINCARKIVHRILYGIRKRNSSFPVINFVSVLWIGAIIDSFNSCDSSSFQIQTISYVTLSEELITGYF